MCGPDHTHMRHCFVQCFIFRSMIVSVSISSIFLIFVFFFLLLIFLPPPYYSSSLFFFLFPLLILILLLCYFFPSILFSSSLLCIHCKLRIFQSFEEWCEQQLKDHNVVKFEDFKDSKNDAHNQVPPRHALEKVIQPQCFHGNGISVPTDLWQIHEDDTPKPLWCRGCDANYHIPIWKK